MIVCTYERRGARLVGRCPEYGLAAEGIDRDTVEAELVRMVTMALGRDDARCFTHQATVELATATSSSTHPAEQSCSTG